MTAEQWQQQFANEAHERMLQEQREKEEAMRRAEEEARRPKLLTREEFLALQQSVPPAPVRVQITPSKPQAKPQMSESKMRVMGMIGGMIDNASGARQSPAGMQMNTTMEDGVIQETTTSDMNGMLQSMKENPIISGGMLMIGLVIVMVGLHVTNAMTAMVADGLGLARP